LAFAEVLSWAFVPDLSLCLIEPSHNEQTANHDDKKYCPAFHVGAALAFEGTDAFLERHDKSVIAAFTVPAPPITPLIKPVCDASPEANR
jgi:hypothetical protein